MSWLPKLRRQSAHCTSLSAATVLVFSSSQLLIMTPFGSDGNGHLWEDQAHHLTRAISKTLLQYHYITFICFLTPVHYIYISLLDLPHSSWLQGSCQAATPACHGSCRRSFTASHDKSQQWKCKGSQSQLGNNRVEITHANCIESPCTYLLWYSSVLHVHMQIFGPWPYSTYMQLIIFKSLSL